MTRLERLRDKANSLPMSAGVYIMKNSASEVIYVGKSKKLKNRVTSYFSSGSHSYKTVKLVGQIDDFDYIVCDTEIEALTLENVLIKKHTPKYNIKLKDAKSYPYIKVTDEQFPRLIVTRERGADKGRYFGPYSGVATAYAALDTVKRIFALPTCKRTFPRDIGRERPCIYLDMGRCCAPCTGRVKAEDYRELIKCAEKIFDGRVGDVKARLTKQMEDAAEELEFERAAALRDSIAAIDRLTEKQKVVASVDTDRDVFALHVSETEGALAILSVRDGALINKNEFILSSFELAAPEDAVPLITSYYDTAGSVPREIMLDFELSEAEQTFLSEYLSPLAGRRVTVRVPERGVGRKLCDLALENAKEAARQHRLEGEREDKNLSTLSELLGLAVIPKRIEAYDISNIGSENITASMVVYAEGKMKKSDYRVFSIGSTAGVDDYASMKEALTRRLSHLGDGSASLSETPDVILLDGGIGHVNAVKEVLSKKGLDIPLFGMVKDDFHKTRAITDGEKEISIAHEMGVYGLIYNIQEEAHRFAVKHSSGAKRKTLTHSSLEAIDGIGPKKAKLLLGSMPLSLIREASKEQLLAVKGISEADSERIHAYFEEKRAKGKTKKGR